MELSFIIRFASAAVRACRDMGGFLPSVMIAMFCVETGYGKGSGCAPLMLWFNLLGMKADLHKFYTSKYWNGNASSKKTPEYYGYWTTIEDAFCVYTSAYQCCMDFLSFMRDGIVDGKNYKYRDLMSCTDPATIAQALQDRKYATDPNYAKKLMNIIKKYNLTKFDGANVPEAPFIADLIAINEAQVPAHNANSHLYLSLHYLGVEGENPNLYGGGKGGHFYTSKTGACSEAALVTDKIWHVGASSGYKYIHPTARNENTIGIECGTFKKDGKWYFTEETQKAAAKLAAWIMFVLDIPMENLLRHGDITTKHCPAPYIDYEGQGTNWTWSQFKQEVRNNMSERRTLKIGMTGEDVRQVQEWLLNLGFSDCIDPLRKAKFCDGDFQDRTYKYLCAFQLYEIRVKGRQIGTNGAPDGQCGPLTWAALEQEIAEGNFTKFNFTAADVVAAGIKVGELYKTKGYKWRSAAVAPWNQPWVYDSSCDRGDLHVWYECGLNLGNLNVEGMEKRLPELGAVRVGSVSEIQAGDVVFIGNGHVCLSASSMLDAAGNFKRIDFGSDARMEHGQPHTEKFTNVRLILRPPYKKAQTAPTTASTTVTAAPATATVASSNGTLYRVQAGAFEIQGNAEAQIKRLNAAGFNAKIIYRVQVGAFEIKSNADGRVAKLKEAGFDAKIIEE